MSAETITRSEFKIHPNTLIWSLERAGSFVGQQRQTDQRGDATNNYKDLGLASGVSTSTLAIIRWRPKYPSRSSKPIFISFDPSLPFPVHTSKRDMKITVTGLILATILTIALARDLPEFLHVCKRSDPQLGDCIKASVENVKPYLLRGVPEYKLPSLEPLKLKELASTAGNNINLKLRNVDVHGASNFEVTKIRANIDALRFVIELDLSHLTLEGDYDIDGKVILLRLQGSGPMHGNFTECKAKVKLQAAVTKGEDGQNYVKIVDFKTRIAIGSGQLKLENLFGGDPALGEAINLAINSNFDAFIKEIQPSLESAISDTFLQITNSIITQFTYETLFPMS